MAEATAIETSPATSRTGRLGFRLLGFIARQLAVDARSLALGRISLATLLLYDLGLRARDLAAHYSDQGVWPRAILDARDWSFVWSWHALGGSPAFEGALFALAALAGVCLLVGFWTWFATLASFLLALSVQARNPFLHDGQDDLLRLLLFWGLWLPLGRRWSVDALRAGRGFNGARRPLTPPSTASGGGGVPGDRVSGICALGLTGQLLLTYESSAVGKLQSGWWTQGNGILRALQLGRYETGGGQWLAAHLPGVLHLLNFPVIGLEAALPLLLWVPWRRDRVRLAAIALAIALHGSFWLFLRLSIFPPLSIAAWLLLLPSSVWDGAGAEEVREVPAHWTRVAAAKAVLLVELLYVVGTHLAQPILPELARRAVEAAGLQQYWVVFSPPRPELVTDGFFVAPGLLQDGSQIDLFKPDERLTWERPALISTSFASSRWRHFYANLVVDWAHGSNQWHDTLLVREATAHWMCRDFEARHPDRKLVRASLYFVEHPVEHPGTEPRRRLLAQVACL